MNIKNTWKHLRKVQTHRKWVRHYCFALGIPWQGIIHDLSKYHPVEFFESIKYYCGDRSPIDKCKEINGYSMAWFHHRGRNKHHYEYWCDNFDKGCIPNLMPKKYFLELIADYLGAGKAYYGDKFTFAKEYEWWKNKRKNPIKMDKRQLTMLDVIFRALAKIEELEGVPDKYLASTEGRKTIEAVYDQYKDGIET